MSGRFTDIATRAFSVLKDMRFPFGRASLRSAQPPSPTSDARNADGPDRMRPLLRTIAEPLGYTGHVLFEISRRREIQEAGAFARAILEIVNDAARRQDE